MKNLKNIMYPFASIIFGLVIIYISELIGLSHLNLAPFGGKSWALWVYPFSFSLSFAFASVLFKIKEKIKIISLIFFVTFLLFFMIVGMNLFYNMTPFGG